ncbi:universal stress protein [Halobacteria archaeon AArc-curdl1]|uniref:Universal stress protein n=1 Tax=Natronosalvus hydrolyticus TaxID=2979988 RepID=A0AAP2Z4U8_9EURY|nr:universal stress protein [Halobacteria archaeon AArc-curdl1]
MYTVLLAIDTSNDRAIAQATAVASLPEATSNVRAVLLHVFDDNPEGASVNRLSSVRRAIGVLEDADVDYELREASGEPATEILQAAESVAADAICVSGRQRTPTGKALFGSVTQSVLLEADRPVLNASID